MTAIMATSVPVEAEDIPHDLTIRVIRLTPELAVEYLKNSIPPRNVRTERIRSLVRAIESKNYFLDGNSLKFNTRGQLIDGTHRCTAVIKSGVPVPTVAIWGIEDAAWVSLDEVTSRSFTDVLKMREVARSRIVAPTTAYLYRYLRAEDKSKNWVYAGSHPTNRELEGCLAEHSEIVQAAEWAETVERFEYFPRSILAFLWLSLGMVDTDDRDAFMRELTVGPRPEEGNPVLILVRNLTSALARRHISPVVTPVYIAWSFKAWNSVRDHTPVKVIVWKATESFPIPH